MDKIVKTYIMDHILKNIPFDMEKIVYIWYFIKIWPYAIVLFKKK